MSHFHRFHRSEAAHDCQNDVRFRNSNVTADIPRSDSNGVYRDRHFHRRDVRHTGDIHSVGVFYRGDHLRVRCRGGCRHGREDNNRRARDDDNGRRHGDRGCHDGNHYGHHGDHRNDVPHRPHRRGHHEFVLRRRGHYDGFHSDHDCDVRRHGVHRHGEVRLHDVHRRGGARRHGAHRHGDVHRHDDVRRHGDVHRHGDDHHGDDHRHGDDPHGDDDDDGGGRQGELHYVQAQYGRQYHDDLCLGRYAWRNCVASLNVCHFQLGSYAREEAQSLLVVLADLDFCLQVVSLWK